MKPLDIRCNHQERTKAADILGDALSAGQIDLDDFEKRSAACVNATTRAELIEPLRAETHGWVELARILERIA